MKKFISGILIGAIVTSGVVAFGANKDVFTATKASFKIFVKGEEFKPTNVPLVVDGRTYLALRDLGNALGTKVDWIDAKREVQVASDQISRVLMKVEIGTVKGAVGEEISIPVSLANIPAGGINNSDMDILYDNEVIEVLSVVPGKSIKDYPGNFSSNVFKDEGRITTLYMDETGVGDQSIKVNGEYIVIKAKVLKDKTTNIYPLAKCLFADQNLKTINCSFEYGMVN